MVKKNRIVAFLIFLIVFTSLMVTTSKDILSNIKLGLDLQGGFEILYEVKPAKEGQVIDEKALAATAEALDRRINVLGVSEPNIQIEGENRIRVQLAGVEDQNEAREILSTEANLSFRDFNDRIMMDGADLAEGGAEQTFDENGKPSVSIKLKSAEKFKEVTQEIVNLTPNNVLVIWLDYEEGKDSFIAESAKADPKYISSPFVSQVFNQNTVSIVGEFSLEEAKNLADILNAGALPVKLDEIYSTSVGASFGEQAMDKTVFAGIIGVLAVFLFMIFYYRFPGFIATITLTVYSYLTILIFDWMNVVLTLPGIAALILGVGMAVDANIITYERIREEIKVGKSIQAAFKAGNQSSFSAVTDANLTTLLASAVLFFYGTSSVKGFATSLIIGILGSFLTNVYLSRWLLGLWVNSKIFNKKPSWFGVKKKEIHPISESFDTLDLPTKFDRFDFVKHRRKFFAFSGVILLLGIVCLFVFRLNLGIDFTSGTRVELLADHALSTETVATELEKLELPTDDIVISGENSNIAVARYKGILSKAEIATLKSHFSKELGSEPNVSSVTPTVGKELAKNALNALLISVIGLIIFVTIRFELRMAVSAVIALLYATFIIIPFFSVTGLEVDITFIAALLTVVGYSINDTIVTFDRMRENMQRRRYLKTYEDIVEVVNTSLRQTLGRSVNTVMMVAITVLSILIWGSEAIRPFSIALLIGLIVGTYSSIFIAAQLWVEWKHKELKKKGVIKTFKEKRTYSDEPQV
ncbi:protein translocase subunit SecDF [Metabacillus litoralis]|jgi:protein-export membrane protein SecD/preprotein translocase SecF subunit|uniref:protein translocase subunit SecDF n=1 Tax=Metabacillus litoralis TaxID=152268 RepID=UPI002041CDB3|nr:protein translocase subunit SecDF [Metabacillus litoralis]MCM3651649.1 protein translocase subunit SecDF [Metabacillus litoralis]